MAKRHVAAGAAAYAGVMFYVARRYRKRKQLHSRSPSVTTASMSEVGGASMFAHNVRISRNSGRSGRTGPGGRLLSPVTSRAPLRCAMETLGYWKVSSPDGYCTDGGSAVHETSV